MLEPIYSVLFIVCCFGVALTLYALAKLSQFYFWIFIEEMAKRL